MLFIRCAFCHKLVFRPLYPRHRTMHTKRLPDGQMTDHITMRPNQRFEGPLKGVPRHYRHAECGGVTTMPEDICRSYLANPFLYGTRSFCARCGTYILYKELTWMETRENLETYFNRLKSDYLRIHGKPPPKRKV